MDLVCHACTNSMKSSMHMHNESFETLSSLVVALFVFGAIQELSFR